MDVYIHCRRESDGKKESPYSKSHEEERYTLHACMHACIGSFAVTLSALCMQVFLQSHSLSRAWVDIYIERVRG